MKDSWFELMLTFFEKTIAHLKEQHVANNVKEDIQALMVELSDSPEATPRTVKVEVEQIKAPLPHSVRVFTPGEQIKLTKASHQFLMRMVSWGIVSSESLELIMNRLIFSESRIVSLQETKWMIRNTLMGGLNFDQVAFLDLILYQKEDSLPLH